MWLWNWSQSSLGRGAKCLSGHQTRLEGQIGSYIRNVQPNISSEWIFCSIEHTILMHAVKCFALSQRDGQRSESTSPFQVTVWFCPKWSQGHWCVKVEIYEQTWERWRWDHFVTQDMFGSELSHKDASGPELKKVCEPTTDLFLLLYPTVHNSYKLIPY